MRKLMMAVAATAVLASAALFTDTRPANAQSASQNALKTAFETGDLQVSYVQRRGGGRGGAYRGHGGRGAVAYRGAGGRGAVAYRGAGGRGAVAYRGGRPDYGRPGYGRPGYGPGYRPGYRPVYGGGYYGNPYYRGYGYGGAALGLATGAVVGSAIASQPVYAAPAYGGGNAVAYCAQRYKSYDPGSGTFLGYDGLRHSCP